MSYRGWYTDTGRDCVCVNLEGFSDAVARSMQLEKQLN
jgi:hypothetical protein